jgi:uncharacterized repeat protein (TIGR01451 family)
MASFATQFIRSSETHSSRVGSTFASRLGSALLIASLLLSGVSPVFGQLPEPVQTYFLALPEADVRSEFQTLQPNRTVGNVMRVGTSVTITRDDTIIYYDQWENGYENDIGSPNRIYSGSRLDGTQIWGDNDPSNGIPPGFASDELMAGDIIALKNDVQLPRNSNTVYFDGRDKLAASKAVAVSRAQWAINPGPVLAGAVELLTIDESGTEYLIPVGEDLSSNRVFEHCSLSIMAMRNGTRVEVDTDADGSVDTARNLGQGETLFISSGVMVGASVNSTKPVQVHLMTGNLSTRGGNLEGRWYTMLPRHRWGRDYYCPVGSVNNPAQPVRLFLFNPNPTPLTIAHESTDDSGTFTVASMATEEFIMPVNSAANLTADNDFFGVAAVAAGSNNGGSSAEDNDTWDWGYTPVPTENLTPQLVVGWGPGADDANNNGTPDGNGSPVYVASTADTTVYVDYDGNASTGPLTDIAGNRYDLALNLRRLEQRKIYDPSGDMDQTGMKLYTLDGALLTGAWGEDPSEAGAGNPYLDLGTTIPPHPWPRVLKTSREMSDADGVYEPNDIIEYTISVENLGVVVLTELVVTDPLPAGLSYVPGSTVRNGQPYPDDSTGSVYPLDGAGVELPPIARFETGTISFQVRINGGVTGTIKNVAFVTTGPENFQGINCIEVEPPSANPCVLRFTDSSFNAVANYQEGEDLYVELQDQDLNMDPFSVNTFLLTIENTATGDRESILLTETGNNTGVFRSGALTSSPTAGQSTQDGTLHMSSGQSVQANYQDPLFPFETCTVPVTVFVPSEVKQLYLTGGGPPYNAGLDRFDPVAAGDTATRTSGVLSATGSSGGGITLDYTASAVNPGGTGGVTLSTFATGAGDNRLMLVGVAIDQNSNAEVSGITYAGQSLSRVVAQDNGAGPGRVEIWQLVAPPSGNSNVVVSMNGQAHNGIVAVAAAFTGVDGGDPLGTPNSADSSSVTVASDAGELVFGMIASGSSSALVGAEGQIQLQQTGDGADVRGAGVTRLGAGAVTLSWLGGASEATAGVSIKPVQDGDSAGVAIWHGSGSTQPEYAVFDGVSFGSASSMPSVGDDKGGMLMSAASPTNPNEAIFLEIADDRQIDVLIWDGSTGTFTTALTNIAQVDHDEFFGASVAYETGGDALLVYAKSGDEDRLYYRTWDGSSWSSEQSYSYDTKENLRHIKMASSPSSDEIVVIAVNESDKDHFAYVWNGNSFVSRRALDPDDDSNGHGYYDIDVAYETLSGRAMVAYARNHSPGRIFYRFWNGSSWTGENTLTYPSSGSNGKVACLNLGSDLKSNRIGIAVTTSGNDAWAAVWNGGAWQDKRTLEVSDTDERNPSESDVAFESASGQMLAVTWDKDRDYIHYWTWNAGSGWSGQSNGPDFGDEPRILQLFSDPLPSSRQIMLMVNDEGADVSSVLWNGTSWGTVTQHESNTGMNGDNSGMPVTFFWDAGAVSTVDDLASSGFFPQIPPMADEFIMPMGGGISISSYIGLTSGGTPGTASSQVSSGFDDVEEEGPDTTWFYPGAMYVASTDLELVRDDDSPSSGAQNVGIRFNGLTVPAGARITNAYITFTADSPEWPNTNSGAASITFRAQAADNPGTFSYSDFNVTSRITTTASVDWPNIPAWSTGSEYNSPDLSTIVQEIVDRPGWSTGNSMVFVINGSGSRTAESYEGSSSRAPQLTIEYVEGGGMPANPTINATLLEDSIEILNFTNPAVTDLGGGDYRLDWGGMLPAETTIEAGNSINLSIDNQQSGLEFQVLFDSTTYPSQIVMPTTTVIEVDNVQVYDAPYPSGNPIASGFTGQTLYIRSTVSDPFGAYDISSASLVIDQLNGTDGDFTHAFINDEVVDATDASKTFEFEWYSPDAEGDYRLEVTAKEGLENTIEDDGGAEFVLTKEDTGSPGEVIFTDAAASRRTAFSASEPVCLQLTDFDHRGAGTLLVGVTSTAGLNEMRALTETGADTGVFSTCYAAGTFVDGEQITAIYVDPSDPTDSSLDVAVIDDPVTPPVVLLSHNQVQPVDGIATVGSEVVFEIFVSNPGATTLDEVTVTDVFPATNLQFISSSHTPDTSVPGTLTWTGLGPLAQSESVTITVRFEALLETASALCSASCSGTVTAGPNDADVEITRPEVMVTKTLTSPVSAEVNYGELVTFRVTVQNTGSTEIVSLPLVDEHGSSLEYVSATVTPDADAGGTISWTDLTGAGFLGVGASTSVDVTFRAVGRSDPAPNLAIVSGALDVNGDPAPRAEAEDSVKTNAAAIGDYVWWDQDADGVQDAHEVGIAGVDVYLDTNANGAHDSDEPIETTDATGFYQIRDQDAGSYLVRVDPSTLPAGVTPSFDPDGTLDNAHQTPSLTVTDTYEDADFGYSAGVATIAGQVRFDSDADGSLADSDVGVQGVSVELWTDPNEDGLPDDGTQMATTVTDSNGDYVFSNLAPGPYVVVEVAVAGVVSTNDKDGNARNSFDQVALTIVATEDSTRNDFLDSSVRDYGDFSSFAVAGSSATNSLRIGAAVDVEPTGLENASATGDDLDGTPDDEDGVTLPVEVGQGQSDTLTINVTNTIGADAFLNVWIDFNGNGSAEAGEQVATNVVIASGTNGADQVVPYTVPITATLGNAGVRVRLTSVSGAGFSGTIGSGEVEDHLLNIVAATDDFGDFSSFGSASSTRDLALTLGATVDAENAAVTDANATGDDNDNLDDEDGVTVPSTMTRGAAATVTATVTNSTGSLAYLNAWVDFDGDGSLDGTGEQIASDVNVASGLSAAAVPLNFTVPAGAQLGTLGVRVRLSSVPNPGSTGFAGSGEVEDYLTSVACPAIAISPSTLTNWKEGVAVNQTFTASAGAAPFTWDITSGSLPPGLSLSTGGVVTGTPSSGALSTFALRVADNFGCTTTESFTVRTCPILTFSPATLPAALIGVPYSETVLPGRGVSPYVFSLESGSLPAGLSLDTATGTLSGTPTTAGAQSFSIRATDANGCTDVVDYSLNPACPVVTITTAALPDGELGSAYSQSLAAANGNGGYTWTLDSGSLPPGLILSTAGVISGTPSSQTAATYGFTVRAVDGFGCEAIASLSIRTCPAEIVVSPLTLPGATVGAGYSITFTAGGQGFAIEQAGSSGIVHEIADADAVLAGTNQAWLVTTTSPVVNYRAGASVEGNFADGSTFPIAGANEFGLRATGEILIPTGGIWTFGTNSDDGVRLRINGTDVIMDDALHSVADNFGQITLPAGVHDLELVFFEHGGTQAVELFAAEGNFSSFNSNFKLIGADDGLEVRRPGGAFNWAVTAGSLPAGLSLNPTSGELSGTPSSPNSQTFTVQATDAEGCSGTREYTLQPVCPPIAITPTTLPHAEVGVTYPAQTLMAAGGAAPYSWSVSSGSVPTGMNLGSSGQLIGTPTTDGLVTFTVQATDATTCFGTESITIRVCPVITLGALTDATSGQAFNGSVAASGGAGPYVYQLTSGSLPSGLALNTATGAVTGTSDTPGTSNFTVEVTDANGCVKSEAYALDVVCPTVTLSPALLNSATVGVAFNQTLSASGGTGPYSFAVTSGTLPTGMTLSGAGVLSGTATSAATVPLTVEATDANGCTGTRNYTLEVVCPTIVVTPASLNTPTVGSPFSQTLSASGGTGPYTFMVSDGALPAGLSLSNGGVLSGTATSDAAATFEVQAADANGCAGALDYTVTPVCPAITLGAGPLAFATEGSSYTATLSASGGTGPYNYAVSSGSLPAGLSLSGAGVISGTPSGNGLGTFTVEATDTFGCVGSETYNLRVCPVIVLANVPAGTVGTAYSETANASGGAAPYSYALTAGSLPAGLALNTSSGAITGTPTAEGTSNFTVEATDANGCVSTRSYALDMNCPAIAVAPASIAQSDINQSFSVFVSGSGGTAPYTYVVSSGALPAGLSLNTTTGEISGTPTVAGLVSFTIESTDTFGCSGTRDYNLRICPSIAISPPALADGVVGTAYTQTFAASNGDGPYVWQLTGTLPTGLSWDAPSATISGTPTTENPGASLTLTATDANGCVGTTTVSLEVACPVISITPGTLPTGYPTIGYSESFAASNGTAPYAWSLVSGSLPDGLALSATGTVSGTPTQLETQTVTIRATDAFGCQADEVVSITIKGMTIGDAVFEDYDNNGVRDPGEGGVAGATVELYDPGDDLVQGGTGSDADTMVAGPITTDSSGAYQFGDLFPGHYFVKVTAPAHFLNTSGTPVLGDTDIDHDNNGAQPGGPDTPLFSSVISLDPGTEPMTDGDADPDTNFTIDFGLWAPMAVGNVVFFDFNGNGTLDSTEGVEGVVVELYPDGADPSSSSAVGAAFTDNKGRYLISDIDPGRYFLHIPASQFAAGGGALAGTPGLRKPDLSPAWTMRSTNAPT